MQWLRKFIIGLLSLVFFGSLLAVAISFSIGQSVGDQKKVTNWTKQSDFYGAFIDSLIAQAQEATDSNNAVAISFQDDSVRQAVQTALPHSVIDNAVDDFLNANYTWLKGKTATPNFKIDLTDAKQSFANELATGAKSRLQTLPACSPTQLLQLQGQQSVNPFTIDCLPPGIDPSAQAASLGQEIQQSNIFLINPVITAKTLNPNDTSTDTEPYYESLSFAPSAYQLNKVAPYILAGIALLCGAGVVFAARRKLFGLRYIGVILVISGGLLVLVEPLTNSLTHKITTVLTSSDAVGQLQTTLSAILDKALRAAANYDFWFGVSYVVIGALLIFVTMLLKSRSRPSPTPTVTRTTTHNEPRINITKPKPSKPPRLIQ